MERSGVITSALLLVTASYVASASGGQARPDTLEGITEDVLETILENSTRDVEDSQFAETLFEVSQSPIDLNSASESDVRQIPGIDPLLAARIVTYRNQHPFVSVDELLLVEGVDPELYRRIRGFLRVTDDRDRIQGGALSLHYTGRTIRDLQLRRGFRDGIYQGNPYKIYNKLVARYTIGSLYSVEAGGLTEKDPGEKKVTDFSAGYL
ncbi:MAG TPA: helix-hairpin-helix domain-containing protein, partial [Bacteroidota bacterium]